MTIRKTLFMLMPAVLAACGAPEAEAPRRQGTADTSDAEGWSTLFDGSDLERFDLLGDANWNVSDGVVRADSGSGFLVTRGTYDDFELELEFYVDVPANSGVFFRCAEREEINAGSCYEANVFDMRPEQNYRSGAIVDVAEPLAVVNTGGRWNRYSITADGSRLVVELNGTVTVDTLDDRFVGGPIALQYGSGTVMFRDVRVRSR